MTGSPPWESHYPPGLRADAALPAWPLTDLLDHAAATWPDRPALEYRGHRLTYAELHRRVEATAALLATHGIGRGSVVALHLPNTPWHPVVFFAALRAGAMVAHLSPLDPPRVLARKLADVGATALVATNLPGLWPSATTLLAEAAVGALFAAPDEAWEGASPGLPIAPAAGLHRLDAPAPTPGAYPRLDAEDVAVLQFTGGTTGLPKAAMLSHANLAAAIGSYTLWTAAQGRAVTAQDRVLGVLPFFHIYALTTVLLRGLAAGAEIMVRPRFDPLVTLEDIERGRATIFSGVPTMWVALAQVPGVERRDFSSLRFIGSGGAPLPAEVADRFQAATGQRLGGGWGMTETSPLGTMLLADVPYRPGMIGVPLPGVEIGIVALDDPLRALAPGETGEIRIRGPNVTRGYFNRPAENAAAFADGWFLTGDIGFMEPDGMFFLIDRKKDMILSGGFNVYPRVIEDALHEHPAIAEAAVIGIPDAYRGQVAKAFIVPRAGADAPAFEELLAFLAPRLGRHEMPAAVEVLAELPKTAVGKISRKDLAERPAVQG